MHVIMVAIVKKINLGFFFTKKYLIQVSLTVHYNDQELIFKKSSLVT